MSGAEAARRLGAPIVECDECGATCSLDTALRLAVYGKVYKNNRPELVSSFEMCSLACLVKRGGEAFYTGRVSIAERWSKSREEWVRIGVRNDLARLDTSWQWDDTGSARWIEENAARLREAGKIS